MRTFVFFSVFFALFHINGVCADKDVKYEHRNKHLILSDGERSLFWFYTIHTESAENPIFNEIELKIDEFCPDVVFVEGGCNRRRDTTNADAIKNGESSFASFYAKSKGILVKDIEPPFEDQLRYLKPKYSTESILAFYIVRQIGSVQLVGNVRKLSLEQIMKGMMNDLVKGGLVIDSTLLGFDRLLEVVNLNISKKIDSTNWEGSKMYKEYASNYRRGNNALQNIYKEIVSYRNNYLVSLLEKSKNEYKRIFIVMGNAHLTETKDSLIKLYKN